MRPGAAETMARMAAVGGAYRGKRAARHRELAAARQRDRADTGDSGDARVRSVIAVTATVCAVPASTYWLARKSWMPELTRFVWLVWIVVGFAFTYGNYLTTLDREPSDEVRRRGRRGSAPARRHRRASASCVTSRPAKPHGLIREYGARSIVHVHREPVVRAVAAAPAGRSRRACGRRRRRPARRGAPSRRLRRPRRCR